MTCLPEDWDIGLLSAMIIDYSGKEFFKLVRYGYVRVSSREQNPERQIRAMHEAEIEDGNIYIDKISGQDFMRPEYDKLMRKIRRDDIIVIKSIDRLGRNYGEILEEWRKITKNNGIGIEVIDMPLLNTNHVHPDLTGVFIADIVLQILAYVAQTEREFIKQRQAEGIEAAKRNGVKFGRNKKEVPDGFMMLYDKWRDGTVSVRRAAEILEMSPTTFYRRCREIKEKNNHEKQPHGVF